MEGSRRKVRCSREGLNFELGLWVFPSLHVVGIVVAMCVAAACGPLFFLHVAMTVVGLSVLVAGCGGIHAVATAVVLTLPVKAKARS